MTACPPDETLPWLDGLWSRLWTARQSDRLAHGLLIEGARGVGKRWLAERLARALLCCAPRPDGTACGQCADCHLAAADTHPDLLRVGPDPEAKSGDIPIDAIRALSVRESLTPSRADWKVALIDPADRLTPPAANALLKTLEEPAGRTLLALIGERTSRLPATVRSRCLCLRLDLPPEAQALDWLRPRIGDAAAARLRLARGAPLRALHDIDDALLDQHRQALAGFLELVRGARDPLAAAVAWHEIGAARLLEWLAGWLCELLRLAAAPAPPHLDLPDWRTEFARLAGMLQPAAAHRFLQRILEARILAETTVNPQLLLESLAIDGARIARGPAR